MKDGSNVLACQPDFSVITDKASIIKEPGSTSSP